MVAVRQRKKKKTTKAGAEILATPIDAPHQADPVTGDGLIEVPTEPEPVDDGAEYLDPSDVEEGGLA
jgi:hypothetical protein